MDRDRRRNILIFVTGFGMAAVAVLGGLIRPEFTREFLVVFFLDLPSPADHSSTRGSAGDVHCQQPLGKWLVEIPSDNPFRIDPDNVQFCPY